MREPVRQYLVLLAKDASVIAKGNKRWLHELWYLNSVFLCPIITDEKKSTYRAIALTSFTKITCFNKVRHWLGLKNKKRLRTINPKSTLTFDLSAFGPFKLEHAFFLQNFTEVPKEERQTITRLIKKCVL